MCESAQTTRRSRTKSAIAERRGWQVVEIYRDAGISGAKGRDGRPGLDAMLKDASRRKFDVVMAWAIDRLGRSLVDLLGTIQSLEACGVDLYLDQQAIDTTTPAGKLMFQITGAFAEFEHSMIRTRVNAGLKRAKDQIKQKGHFVTKHGEVKKRLGRPNADPDKLRKALPSASASTKSPRWPASVSALCRRSSAKCSSPKWRQPRKAKGGARHTRPRSCRVSHYRNDRTARAFPSGHTALDGQARLRHIRSMGNKPKHAVKVMKERFMLRVDEEFLAAVQELRRFYEDMPTKAEAIRRAVFAHVEATRKERKGKR
jgi:DNA invertase Pin-like site-specific DNA recombinase